MIELSTSSNIVYWRPDGTTVPLEKTIELVSQAGFPFLDINFYDWLNPSSPFVDDGGWEVWAETIRKTNERFGVRVRQCHGAPNLFATDRFTEEQHERQLELVHRSIVISSLLGAEVVVMHPDTVLTREGRVDVKASKKENLRYFSTLVEFADRHGVKIAVENMNVLPGKDPRFFTWPEEILDFMESAQDSRLGICWDFEHGVIMDMEQAPIIESLGSHLLATHVSDTSSKTDPDFMHILPLFGNLDWKPIMKALKIIRYDGVFSYEVHNYCNRLPDEVLPEALLLARRIGDYLLSL